MKSVPCQTICWPGIFASHLWKREAPSSSGGIHSKPQPPCLPLELCCMTSSCQLHSLQSTLKTLSYSSLIFHFYINYHLLICVAMCYQWPVPRNISHMALLSEVCVCIHHQCHLKGLLIQFTECSMQS